MKKWFKSFAASLIVTLMTARILPVLAATSFTDMPGNGEFCSAIEWAVDPDGNGEYSDAITAGTSGTTFSPRSSVTRAQMVTFLYRAAGQPIVNELAAFSDMPTNPTFQKAISWAADNGITAGYGNGFFGPNDTVTRGQMVTFLYRFNGSPTVSSETVFMDVPANSPYKNAISWAASNGITSGYGNGFFGINDPCTRAQAVTFLYRDAKIYPDIFAVTAPISGNTDIIPEDNPEPTTPSADPEPEINDNLGHTTVSIDLSSIPVYAGSPYAVINNNVPFFSQSEMTTQVFENYSNLDALGRCGTAYANICKELMPTEERGQIGMIKPTGWHTVKYNDLIDGNYLYNRCHLIGYQLAGENANELNLITGTRYLNVIGMLPFENMVADYVKDTGNHVLYRVTPLFAENNLVATGVLMEAKSVEDNGAGILFNIFCYNVQPGIVIDYATGDSYADGSEEQSTEAPTEQPTEVSTEAPTEPLTEVSTEAPTEQPTEVSTEATTEQPTEVSTQQPTEAMTEQSAETPTQPIPVGTDYIGNKNSKKFHYPSCSSVKKMKDSNKYFFNGTRDELISQGYDPCQNCNP